MSGKVYFADFNSQYGDDPLRKFDRLIKNSEIGNIDFNGKYVAVKIHFGEWGNVSFIRHQYSKILADYLKAQGAKVFFTDANTLYPGYRGNAVDHLHCATLNGFNELTLGAPVIIADGLRGTDEREIPVEGAKHVKTAKIGAAIAEADVLITMTHCKGHVEAGYGGVLKNIGMGSGSKRGKMEMHNSGTPGINTKACIGCGMCVRHCANDGVSIIDKKAVINEDKCLGCGYCIAYCPKNAIKCKWNQAHPVLTEKIAEYTKAAIGEKPTYHFAFVNDVQGGCDCAGAHGEVLVPDVGMFAGADAIAVDQACIDAINKAPVNPNGKAAACQHEHDHDVFMVVHPSTDYMAGLVHGENIGIGTREYELVTIK
ncbi:MAG: DUF362 domain-containing protein [Clostridia bacterium]|nr:DUF362 domain-containing protein [Clostridia bacterium]